MKFVFPSLLGFIIAFVVVCIPMGVHAEVEDFSLGKSNSEFPSSIGENALSGEVKNLQLHTAEEASKSLEAQRQKAENELSKKPTDVTYRQTLRTANLDQYGNFSPVESIGNLGQKVLNFLLYLLGLLGLLGIIIGGGMMMFGGVDDSMLERGKEILLYSMIGVAIALLALVFTTLVQTFLYSVDI